MTAIVPAFTSQQEVMRLLWSYSSTLNPGLKYSFWVNFLFIFFQKEYPAHSLQKRIYSHFLFCYTEDMPIARKIKKGGISLWKSYY